MPAKPRIEMVGKTFGELTVIAKGPPAQAGQHQKWLCRCSCGQEKLVRGNALRLGKSKTCGGPAHVCKDMTGKRFGRLIVLRRDMTRLYGKFKTKVYYVCQCDCGKTVSVTQGSLKDGTTKSCGCYRSEKARAMRTTHGLSGTPAYKSWNSMMRRCYKILNKFFYNYGARGIIVCDRWHDFVAFIEDMGQPPSGMTLERIDNDAPYGPENCIWADRETQNNNQRRTRRITHQGKTMSATQWERQLGLPVKARLKKGWTEKRALTEPMHTVRTITHDGKTMTVSQWSKHLGIDVKGRLDKGWSEERALLEPRRINQFR